MKPRNIWLGLRDQLPLKRLFRNVRRNGLACFWHPRTHLRSDGLPKIAYSSKASAIKAALSMEKKTGAAFGKWKCWHCDGYHIGKNSPSNND